MIDAVIFDLDGTLVQTEKLKALSYARAAVELCPNNLTESEVIEEFRTVVGLSRREVAMALMERFGLEPHARQRLDEFGVTAAWQVFVQIRLRIYEALLADSGTIRTNQWPHNIALLHQVRAQGCKVGLATMSYCPQVTRILELLGLVGAFDFIASRDDVRQGKPDPEIYRLVALELDAPPHRCLVIEDSPVGVRAALAARMHVIAVGTPFTRVGLRQIEGLDSQWIVDDPGQLPEVVRRMFNKY